MMPWREQVRILWKWTRAWVLLWPEGSPWWHPAALLPMFVIMVIGFHRGIWWPAAAYLVICILVGRMENGSSR